MNNKGKRFAIRKLTFNREAQIINKLTANKWIKII